MKSPCGIVALLSDFGTLDPFVGVVKGVMLSVKPHLQLIDISHTVRPQNVSQGAFLLSECIDYFPEGTVFWAVVDPGVGSARRAVAVRGRRHYYVAPDNGLLELCLQRDAPFEALEIDGKRWGLQSCSATFHGRDIFAPAAAQLAAGIPWTELGRPLEILNRLPEPFQCRCECGRGESIVLHIDTFGNLITSWRREDGEVEAAMCAGQRIKKRRTYAEVAAGELLTYWGSSGYLEIGANCASAQMILGVDLGERVQIALAAH